MKRKLLRRNKKDKPKRERTRPEIDEVKTRPTKDGGFEIVLNEVTSLPKVSVITITKDRLNMFDMALRNWNNFKYPKDSIEWIIVDDSKTESLKDILPNDERIKYFHLKSILPIVDKRNYALKKAKGEIIVIMDDDDYHFNDSVLSKVRILLDNPEKDCICSLPIGTYSITNGQSVITNTEGDDIPEATLTFRKSFWKNGKFANHPNGIDSEWYGLCNNRWDRLLNLPFWFNIIALNHSKNTTGNLRQLFKNNRDSSSFIKYWDEETVKIIKKFRQLN